MPRCDNLIANLQKQTIICSNLGVGEQGAVLAQIKKAIYIVPDNEKAVQMKQQLFALNKACVLVDEFDKPYTLARFQSKQNKFEMLKTLKSLLTDDAIIISTPQLLLTYCTNLAEIKNNIIKIEKGKNYKIADLEKQLVTIGYKKVDVITNKGEFCVRGDIVDVFNVTDENPTRLDFFDTNLENLNSFDYLNFQKVEDLKSTDIYPNKLLFLTNNEKEKVIKQFNNFKIEDNLFFELITLLEQNEDVPLEFVAPFVDGLNLFADLNLPIIISNELKVATIFNAYIENLKEKIKLIFKSKEITNCFLNSINYTKIDEFYAKNLKNLVFFDNFDLKNSNLYQSLKFETFDLKNSNLYQTLKTDVLSIDFKTQNFPTFLYNLNALKNELEPFQDKQIFLCLSNDSTLKSVKKIFDDTLTPYSTNVNNKGIILTTLDIPYNICFAEDEKFYIGSTNFAHKKVASKQKSVAVKYLPKAGEYVVHSKHGVGKCEGIVTIKTLGVDKEFFKLSYRDGDTLYVPYENADTLSLYLADSDHVTLNKLGGKEFATQKLRAVKSIEDMSKELLELYAKRSASKGFKYPEDDYILTEFENSFEFTETVDQLHAIEDIKHDMISGKVMDRLVCGDVGFGKTEVAMRALFKTIEAGKQVAFLAPTTVLSLQHYMTTLKRTQNFGVNVEMLNRFRTQKEQKQIVEDLKNNKINVICGTHRLLSDDVKFADLGLLILDEEQRFGVKAKEHIKQLKNNVNVLTLSATPIPRTLSMALTSIRDISIINTPPVNRLPVKTYVIGYNEQIILNAINDEIERGGQVLVIYNNIENIYKVASKLETALHNKKAKFDVAHGQMTEIALENAVKRLYDGKTNVFVSTTLIENGVDLPKANTLIVLDSDKLGLSQMYQLRGRVGRSTEQAYAYFTFPKNKPLTEDASNRLQAIAENTELGSGFKIAMRDLSIRGAGELLGKTQHGHLVKIGYDMYYKLLNDTLRKMKGEKVETEREVKIEIAITSKIPTDFVLDETERLKIISKISNITSKESLRSVIGELASTYGKLPKEIYTLSNIAYIKALAKAQKVKNIIINKNKMSVVYYDDVELSKLLKKVNKFTHFKFENTALPTINLNTNYFSVQTAMNYVLEFLSEE